MIREYLFPAGWNTGIYYVGSVTFDPARTILNRWGDDGTVVTVRAYNMDSGKFQREIFEEGRLIEEHQQPRGAP